MTILQLTMLSLEIFGTMGWKTKRSRFSKFRSFDPSPTKEADQCHEDLQHVLQVGDKVGVVYSDNAPELKDAVKRMKFRHNTSRAHVDENKAVIEREIRTVLEGTGANLTQVCLPDSLWPYAAQHHAMALNTKHD